MGRIVNYGQLSGLARQRVREAGYTPDSGSQTATRSSSSKSRSSYEESGHLRSSDSWESTLKPETAEQIKSGELATTRAGVDQGFYIVGGELVAGDEKAAKAVAEYQEKKELEKIQAKQHEQFKRAAYKKAGFAPYKQPDPASTDGLKLTNMLYSPTGDIATPGTGVAIPRPTVVSTQTITVERAPGRWAKANMYVSEKLGLTKLSEHISEKEQEQRQRLKAKTGQAADSIRHWKPLTPVAVVLDWVETKGLDMAGGVRTGFQEHILKKPLTTAAYVAGGYVVGGVAAGAGKVGSIVAKSKPVAGALIKTAPKGIGMGALTIYAGAKSYQIYTAETYEQKGEAIGEGLVEFGAFYTGAKLYQVTPKAIKGIKAQRRATIFDKGIRTFEQRIKGEPWRQQGQFGTKYVPDKVVRLDVTPAGARPTYSTIPVQMHPKGAMASNPLGRGEWQLPLKGSVQPVRGSTVKVRAIGQRTYSTYSTRPQFAMEGFKFKATNLYKYDSSFGKLSQYGFKPVMSAGEQRLMLLHSRGGMGTKPLFQYKIPQYTPVYERIRPAGLLTYKPQGVYVRFQGYVLDALKSVPVPFAGKKAAISMGKTTQIFSSSVYREPPPMSMGKTTQIFSSSVYREPPPMLGKKIKPFSFSTKAKTDAAIDFTPGARPYVFGASVLPKPRSKQYTFFQPHNIMPDVGVYRPPVLFGARIDLSPGIKSDFEHSQRQRDDTSPAFTSIVGVGTASTQILRPVQDIIQEQITIDTPIIDDPVINEPVIEPPPRDSGTKPPGEERIKIPPPPTIPFILPKPRQPQSAKKWGRGRKAVKIYVPSLHAITFNIKGKFRKKKLTGLEFRPIRVR